MALQCQGPISVADVCGINGLNLSPSFLPPARELHELANLAVVGSTPYNNKDNPSLFDWYCYPPANFVCNLDGNAVILVPPSNLSPFQLLELTPGTTSIFLRWDLAPNASNALGGYNIYKKTTSTAYALVTNVPATTGTYTDSAVSSGIVYSYYIEAFTGTSTIQSNVRSGQIVVVIPCNQGMDVVFNVDYTASMSNSIEAVKASIVQIIAAIAQESAGNYRLGLVLFDEYPTFSGSRYSNAPDYISLPASQKYVNNNVAFTRSQYITAMEMLSVNNSASFTTQLNKINKPSFLLGAGADKPEPGDMAVDRIINFDFAGSLRADAAKLIIYMTDAPMSGDDDVNNSIDTARAPVLAAQCVARGVRVLLMKASSANLGPVETLALNSKGAVYNSFAPSAIIQAIRDICV